MTTNSHQDDPEDGLAPSDAALLELEDAWQLGRLSDDKEALIRDRLGVSSPRYHQRLNELLDDPVAASHSPALIGRLRRVREQRRAARSADRLE
ncbi:DUF3263 domain-containing protein [Acidipropionibacterium virtanenii]|uniref:DUF3263 domain-containing protein n=1 Tax=Acidipropionibacterium virtanenii TaxID=2057246 RepID=A0A344UWB4_9ACTN|nr:DUF3263 domain-containing protein [Acidipropionibacterium virtanenii]AXE39562.1 hypothetical protein JS278_02423 [Acidipropionibacterium virtanenii]